MIKVKRLNYKGLPSSCGVRLAKLGDIITLKNGDMIGVAWHTDNTKSCNDLCYFASNDRMMNVNFCKGTSVIEKEVPNFEMYVKPAKFKNCFLRAGWHFVKIGNKKEGI